MTETEYATPYHAAWDMITLHSTSGGSYRLAKLVMSLYNGYDYPFSIRECLEGQDSKLERISLEMVAYFIENGEDAALREIGRMVLEHYPRLAKLGEAIYEAKESFNKRDD